ncbi:MAG TPA: YlbF family regulator [Syntrophomonadaceae bacterium]|nr:YlbF family regulator [Syntrophomonadaceae bacterium]HRX20183.1 YlbF family regulator [Syntrophomonadaceae bacterium]
MDTQNTFDIAHQLAKAIKENQIYLAYIKAQKSIEEQPELKEKIRAFREKQTNINHMHFLGQEIQPELIKEISLEFARLNTNKTAADFFEAEADFIRMFNEVQEIIQKEVMAGFIDK